MRASSVSGTSLRQPIELIRPCGPGSIWASSGLRSRSSRSGSPRLDLAQQVGAADGLLQRAQAQRRQDLAHLLGDEAHQVDDLLRRAGEALAQVGALGADADRAGVGVALADQDAAHGDQGQRADAVLLGPEQGGDDDVAAGLDAAVGAQGDAVAQAVEGQDLVDLATGPSPRACRHI